VEALKSVILTIACVERFLDVEKAVLLSRLEEEYQVMALIHNNFQKFLCAVKSDNFLNFQIFNTRFEFFDKLDKSEALEYP